MILVWAAAALGLACAMETMSPSEVQRLPAHVVVLDKLLEEIGSDKHHDTDNPCLGTVDLNVVPPFICWMQLPVIALQWLPQFSLDWTLGHSSPDALFAIAFLSSTTGDVIPERIGEFHNLLALHAASVSAPLPAALSQLSLLQAFDVLEVRGGPIAMPEFDRMPGLQWLQLQNVEGGITGAWPTFANHTQLASVMFPSAGIESPPPERLFQLPSVLGVDLGGNPVFNGPLPENISPNIDDLRLDQTGAKGTIPASYACLSQLTYLALFANQLTGTIPSEFGALTKLEALVLQQNRLSGSIPSWLGNLVALESLQVDDNRLQGTLPTELGLITSLTTLSISNNRFSGTLPVELQHLTALREFLLQSNQFTGLVLCLAPAVTIECSDNYLTGKPPDQCRDGWTADCDFSGLSDQRCEQRETLCNPWDKRYAVFGEGCVHLSLLVPVPAAVVFTFVLGVFLWSYRRAGGPLTCLALGWSVVASTIAALEFASSWTTLLAFYFDLSSPLGPAACCVFVVVVLFHGVTGCALCPSKSDLRAPAVLTILLSRQLLVEVPWRVVFARHGRSSSKSSSNNNNRDDRGHGMISPGDSEGPPSRVVAPAETGADATKLMLRFTRRAAFAQVAMNTAVFGCQVGLWYHHRTSHLAELAVVLSSACLGVSALLLVVHWRNERRHSRPRQA